LGNFLAAYNSIAYPAYIKEVLQTDLALDRVLRLYDQVHHEADGYQLLPGVYDLFSELHEAGIPIGILSNASSAKLQQKLEAVEDLITDIWSCGEVLPAKPHPDCLLSVFRKYHELRPQEIVFVGDSLIDWRTVSDSKVNFIAVLTGSHTRVDFEGAGVPRNMIIEDMTHLRVIGA
jgi:phosphoglycolate phosphatase